ncbi:hypothetical protein GGI35DRAFT_242071 [Trichoderma velutinum]
MPLYQVEHSDPLTRAEKDELAAKITDIHKNAYGSPTPFISVVFEDISKSDFYEGGVLKPGYNRIFAIVRIGGSRTSKTLTSFVLSSVMLGGKLSPGMTLQLKM